jgi:hypothetical protein
MKENSFKLIQTTLKQKSEWLENVKIYNLEYTLVEFSHRTSI